MTNKSHIISLKVIAIDSHYIAVEYSHENTVISKITQNGKATKDTPYPALTGEPRGVFSIFTGEKIPLKHIA